MRNMWVFEDGGEFLEESDAMNNEKENLGRRKLYDTNLYAKRYEIPVGLLLPKEFIEKLIQKELRKVKIRDKNHEKRILYLERKIRDMEMIR